jgi:hypothetical protein
MVKRISFIMISVAILVAGYFALNKLSYWERSVRIFSFNSDQVFERRMGKGQGGGEGRGQFRRNEGERMEGVAFEGRMRGGEGRGRGEFQGGEKINLRNVVWFLAVFASFTIISIYIDKAYCLIKKRRNGAKA